MKIETKIRKAAQKKLYVGITNRKRSKHGFFVNTPSGSKYAATKAEALQMLLAKIRCMDGIMLSITVRHADIKD